MNRLWIGGALALCLLAGAAPGQAQYGHRDPYRHDRWGPSSSFRLHAGIFTPDGKSDYFTDAERDFTGTAKDFEDSEGGIDYILELQRNLGIQFSASYFQGQNDLAYRDFTEPNGQHIVHTTTLEITPVTAGLVVTLAPDQSPIKPYIGGGGGVYAWRLREEGDFIDFTRPSLPIFSDNLKADGAALGWYALAGVDVPLSPYFSVFAEARWDRADDKLNKDFEGLGTIDLSGRRVSGGIAWRF